MKRVLVFAWFAAVLVCGPMLAQTKKAPKASKATARQELVPAPLRSDSAPAVAAHANPLNFPGVQFPRIEADNRVTFRFTAPTAQKVQVSIVNVPFDMTKGADGAWTYTSEPQAPGYHNYWMIVDGAIVIDPGTQGFIGYGHLCNGFEIPEPGVTFYDIKNVPHGNVQIKNYWAKTTNAWRHIFVYTPPGYETNLKTRYPVFYLQHGGGEDERVWTEMGRTNVILDNLLSEGKVKPMIVVMETSAVGPPPAGRGAGAPAPGAPPAAAPGAAPAAPGAAPGARAPGGMGIGGPGGGAYGQFMTSELIPWIDANFRTIPDRDHRAMAGLSMGGMQTISVTMANLDKFSHIGLFSGGASAGGRGGRAGQPAPAPTAPDFKTIYNGNMADPAEWNRKVHVFYFSCGSLENEAGLKKHQEDLVAYGIKNSYVYISPGTAHEWQTWRRSLYTFAPLLFK